MATGEQNRTHNSSITTGQDEQRSTEQRGLVGQIGPLEVDWPKTLGYYGGLGVALAAGLIEPPIALFIAAVPFFKLLSRPNAPQWEWTAGQILDGASTPVGGSASPVLRVKSRGERHHAGALVGRGFGPLREIWVEAQSVAHGTRGEQLALPPGRGGDGQTSKT